MTEDFTLEQLLHEIATERGTDFRGYKRSTLERRIRKRMFEVKAPDYRHYSEYLRANPDEINELINTILINVTEFFRDPQAWEVLRKDVLPRLFAGKQPGDSIRCWSAGCATGEEPYSIAILLAEYFGDKVQEYDIKIYGTDIDEEALSVARRAEYAPDRLRHVRSEWRKKYFQGEGALRVNRDLRRLCIFGRSNVISDAPISHVDLLVCRNLLIYFNSLTQAQILSRLHYALEPHGVLFIGKASSLVGAAHLFQPLNSKFRIFQRADAPSKYQAEEAAASGEERSPTDDGEFLRLQHSALLETLDPGVLVLDAKDAVLSESPSAAELWRIKSPLLGKPVGETDLSTLCPDLSFHLEQTRAKNEAVNFQASSGRGAKSHTISITLKPVIDAGGARVGTLVYMEDISPREQLQSTIEELQATGEELQSANEELETTNEELQSTNEELETTNEELQSLNEELSTANEELATRGKEMDELNTRYAETLERMPWPVMVVGRRLRIEFWNAPAQKLFGFQSVPAVSLSLEQLPAPLQFRKRLVRRHRRTLARNLGGTLRGEVLEDQNGQLTLDIHFTPLSADGAAQDVLIMFEVTSRVRPAGTEGRGAGSGRSRPAGRSKKKAPKRGAAKRRSG